MGGHVFISYSRSDREYVDRLVTALGDAGVDIWIDRTGIDAGDWERKIETAISECAHFVLVVSPASKKSDRVSDEWHFARESLRDDQIHILVRERVPWMSISRYHQHDVTDGSIPTGDLFRALGVASPSESGYAETAPGAPEELDADTQAASDWWFTADLPPEATIREHRLSPRNVVEIAAVGDFARVRHAGSGLTTTLHTGDPWRRFVSNWATTGLAATDDEVERLIAAVAERVTVDSGR